MSKESYRISTLRRLESNGLKATLRAVLSDPEHSPLSQFYAKGMPMLICLSVVCTLAQTLEVIGGVTAAALEISAEIIFVIDLLLRFHVQKSKARFLWQFHNIVDVLNVVPLIIRVCMGCVLSEEQKETFLGSTLLYIVPNIRLLKTLRNLKAFNLIGVTVVRVYIETWPTIMLFGYICLIFSALIYYNEPRSNIESFPQAIWFCLVTMSTVGYGDVGPSSSGGYAVSAVMVCSSPFIMALPLGIIGTAVSETWKNRHTLLLRSWLSERLERWGYTAADLPHFFAAYDDDENGVIDFDEFCSMLEEMKLGIKADKMRELFLSFDDDRSGSIDAIEFITKLFPDPKVRHALSKVGSMLDSARSSRSTVKSQD
jgi:hypothetical protein